MDKIVKDGEMENREILEVRPLCVHCKNENRLHPKLGILYVDLDGKGRRPTCGEHYDIAKQNARKVQEAMLRDMTGTLAA